MTGFEFSPPRIVFGRDRVDGVGELAREWCSRRVFVVTDPGVAYAGHANRVEAALAASGLEVRQFDGVRENPTTLDVEACVAALGDWDAELLVGVGGGSSIDVAKGCAFVRAGGGRMQDYRGKGLAKGRLLPLIAIPTTAGTGTETQSFALIGDEATHQKMACGDRQATPVLALLDPTLTVTLPPFVTACTGLDAIGHAVETAVTKAGTEVSRLFSTEAFRLAHVALPRALRDPGDLDARGQMLLAAAWAGIAIEHSMLGAAHSLANPLTARHGIPHGQAVGMMLPHVVRFNASDPGAAVRYAALARDARLCAADVGERTAIDALAAKLEELLVATELAGNLTAFGVTPAVTPALGAEAAQQWTAQFNPRAINAGDFQRLLDGACATA